MDSLQGKTRPGPVSKNALYQAASSHAVEAIAVLVEIMRNGDSDSNKVGAAKAILAKCLPDLKQTGWGDEEREMVKQILGGLSVSSNNGNPQAPGTQETN